MNNSGASETLASLYAEHQGKVSDKWSIYLRKYDELFSPIRARNVRMLEIGVQNGGSLEIWSRYFSNATIVVGCDINPKCSALSFSDGRIVLVVGDANLDETEQTIAAYCQELDIIIDDGSHESADIIASFARYFHRLSDGGIFIAEDLHCSYWERFGGGLYDPYSSISFFKRLLDIINSEHWGLSLSRRDALAAFEKKYKLRFEEELLSSIHSIEFANSLCIIRKRPANENVLGPRRVVGIQAAVEEDVLNSDGKRSEPKDESGNRWAFLSVPLEEEIERCRSLSALSQSEYENNVDQVQMMNEESVLKDHVIKLELELERKISTVTKLEREIELAKNVRNEFDTLLSGYKKHIDLLLEELKVRENCALSKEREESKVRKSEENFLQEKLHATEQRLQERFSEIAMASRLLREQEEQNTWLRLVIGAIIGDSRRGRLIDMLPGPLAMALRRRQLRRRGLFDPGAYHRANPDVAKAGGDPLRHYILHGLNEHRRTR